MAYHALEKAVIAMTGYGCPSFGSFYVKNEHGFWDAVVDRKGDGFAETGTAVLVVVLCPVEKFHSDMSGRGGREAFARSSAMLR